jgi:hypothetical protein
MKALQDMLLSVSAAVKEQALVCLAQLSYAATRPLLLRFVKEEANPNLVRKAGVILRNNPDLDAVRNVYDTMRLAREPRRSLLKEILQECLEGCLAAGLLQGTVQEHLERLRREAAAAEMPTI